MSKSYRLTKLMRKAAWGEPTQECIVADWVKNRPTYRLPSGKTVTASRAVWMMAHGDPGELYVLHTCHNGYCLNPLHLYLGTQKDNMRDMDQARRRNSSKTYKTKLSIHREEIRELFRQGMTPTQIGKRFNASKQSISYYVRDLHQTP